MAMLRWRKNNPTPPTKVESGFVSPAVDELPAELAARLEAVLESSERFKQLGLYSAALDECYQAISLLPTYIPIHITVGEIHAARGRIDEAIAEYAVIARLYLARDDPAGAVGMYRKIVQLRAGDAQARSQLVQLLAQTTSVDQLMGEQRWADAVLLLEAQAQTMPEDDTLLVKLAEARFRLGEFAGCFRAFDRLAQVYLARGDRQRALGIVKVMKELAPGMILPDSLGTLEND